MDFGADGVGRSESTSDIFGATPLRALAATLDHPATVWTHGTALPPLWHWLYFLPLLRHGDIGPDGHARRGGFLPPVPLPRRMWAGSQFEFFAPLRVGDAVLRTSTIDSVTHKAGRSGALVFVKVRHELRRQNDQAIALREFHDIVYRAAPQPGDAEAAPVAAPTGALWTRPVQADDVLLFRYSALTFNAHRIHYDRRYATQTEGYPGLVVHGPLIATLLLDLLHQHAPSAQVVRFQFKALRPTFDVHAFSIHGARDGDNVRLWAQDHDGWLTMDATATLSD